MLLVWLTEEQGREKSGGLWRKVLFFKWGCSSQFSIISY